MNKHLTQSLKFFLLLILALSSACGPVTAIPSPTLTPAPSQTPIATVTPSPTKIPRLNGYLVYSSDGSIFLFDFKNETVRPILQFGDGYLYPEYAVDNKAIYFLSNIQIDGSEGATQLFKMNLDGTAIEQLTFDSGATPDKFNLSGVDNTDKLAYIRLGDTSSVVIFDKNTKKELGVITDKDGYDYYQPSWSPDGKKIIFFKADVKERSTSYVVRFGSLVLYNVDTGEVTELLPEEIVPIIKPSWSPGGSKIVFSRMVGADYISVDIYTLEIDNGTVERLVAGQPNTGQFLYYYYNWSPNGKLIMYQDYLKDQLFIFNLRRSEIIPVGYLDFGLGAHGGLWSPDGRYIAYIIGPSQNPADTLSKRLTLLNIQDTETGELFQYKVPWGKFVEMVSWIYP